MLADSGMMDLQNEGKGVWLHVVSLDADVEELDRVSMRNIESRETVQSLKAMVRAQV